MLTKFETDGHGIIILIIFYQYYKYYSCILEHGKFTFPIIF